MRKQDTRSYKKASTSTQICGSALHFALGGTPPMDSLESSAPTAIAHIDGAEPTCTTSAVVLL